ncbi:MAG: ATP-binding protein, partial [Paraclostridium sp.]
MEVYALVGESGSGKSYKALELAYENNINYIIDDGILIHKNKILAGISAKQAKTKIEAVKRAIFNNNDHKENVRKKIIEEKVDKILIIGTSDKMVNQISNVLDLGDIYKTIYIKEISTQDEIRIAKKSRESGNHIIPVPTLEVKSIASGLSINPIKKLFKRTNKESIIVEKTIIRPSFSYIGKF